jgi:hypothetical protein
VYAVKMYLDALVKDEGSAEVLFKMGFLPVT